MSTDTRRRMVAGAAELMSRRGVNATSMREVVRHTDTPRGSLVHHFPRGKLQLLEEALQFAGGHVQQSLETLLREQGALDGLRTFLQAWRLRMERSEFNIGCPVLAVSVEQYINDPRDGGPAQAAQAQSGLLALADQAFAGWQKIIAAALRREGIAAARARRLATLTVATVEGSIALCRAARSGRPLEDARVELECLLSIALADARAG